MSCGYEGPRGGACYLNGKWRVFAGDPKTGPHASLYACDRHLDYAKTWVFSQTQSMPEVTPLKRVKIRDFNRRDVAMLGGDPSL